MQSENLIACQSIVGQRDLLADRIVARHYSLRPDLDFRYGGAARTKCVKDARYHLDGLAEAIGAGRPQLFVDYVAWAKVVLCARGIPVQDLAESLELCRQTIEEVLPRSQADVAKQYLLDSLSLFFSMMRLTP